MSAARRSFLNLSLCLSLIFGPTAALAAQVDTLAFANHTPERVTTLSLQQKMASVEARSALLKLGVDPAAVEQRLQNLSPQELAQIEQQLAELPAGAGVAGVVGVVFIVLIVLELLGVTNVFTAF